MRLIILLSLLLAVSPKFVFARSNKAKSHANSLEISNEDSYFLFKGKILECRFSNPNYKHKKLDNLLRIIPGVNESSAVLICCKNDLNYLFNINPNGSLNFIDQRENANTVSLDEGYKMLNRIGNKWARYNPTTAKEALLTLQKNISHAIYGSFNKKEKLTLVLTGYKEDYQLQHFCFILENNSDEDFTPALIETYQDKLKEPSVIYPAMHISPGLIPAKSEKAFSFSLLKSVKGEITVKLKDKYNNKRSIKLTIPKI